MHACSFGEEVRTLGHAGLLRGERSVRWVSHCHRAAALVDVRDDRRLASGRGRDRGRSKPYRTSSHSGHGDYQACEHGRSVGLIPLRGAIGRIRLSQPVSGSEETDRFGVLSTDQLKGADAGRG